MCELLRNYGNASSDGVSGRQRTREEPRKIKRNGAIGSWYPRVSVVGPELREAIGGSWRNRGDTCTQSISGKGICGGRRTHACPIQYQSLYESFRRSSL